MIAWLLIAAAVVLLMVIVLVSLIPDFPGQPPCRNSDLRRWDPDEAPAAWMWDEPPF